MAKTSQIAAWTTLLEALPMGVLLADGTGRILAANEAACRILGETREALFSAGMFDARWRILDDARGGAGGLSPLVPPDTRTPLGRRRFGLRGDDGRTRWLDLDFRDLLNGALLATLEDVTEAHEAEATLIEERARFADLLETQPAGIFRIWSPPLTPTAAVEDWVAMVRSRLVVRFVSDRFCELSGLNRETLVSEPGSFLERIHPDDRADFYAQNTEAFARKSPFRWEGRLLQEGDPLWVRFESTPRDLAEGGTLWTGVLWDIREQKAIERDREHLKNLYAALSHSNEVIFRARGEPEMFRGICEAITRDVGFDLAWIGLAASTDSAIVPAASGGDATGYLEGLRVGLDPATPEGLGPTGTAMREGRVVIIQDWSASAPQMLPWLERGSGFGFKSSAAFPIQVGGKTEAVLTLYSREAGFFQALRVELIASLAENLGWALAHFQEERRRKGAEASLRESDDRARSMLRTTSDAVWIVGPQGQILDMNDAGCAMLGYGREDLPGLTLADIEAPEPRGAAPAPGGRSRDRYESTCRRKDGSRVPVEASVCHLPDYGQRVYFVRDITERHLAEAWIRRISNLLAQAEAIAQVGGWELDHATGEMFWTREIYRILEVEPAAHPPSVESFLQFFNPEWRPVIREAVASGSERDPALDLEMDLITAHGRRIWVRVTSQVATRADGSILTIGILQDISGTKAAHESLRESEHRYRLISENAADVIWVMDVTRGCFTYVSPSVERLRGYKAESVLAQPFKEALTPESHARWLREVADRFPRFEAGDESYRTVSLQLDQPRKDGSVVHTEVTATFLKSEHGRVHQVVGVSRDISQRLEAESRLRASELRHRAIFEGAGEGLYLLDSSRMAFLDVNRAWCDLYGYTREEALGLTVADISAEPAGIPDARPGAQGRSHLRWHRRKNGTLFPVDLLTTSFEEAGARILISSVRDVSESYQLQEDLRDLNRSLEQRVLNRTRQLESANQEMEAFAYSVSHDLKAPLRAISGFTEALQQDLEPALDARGRDHLQRVRTAATRMGQLIEDLLLLSRVGQDDLVMLELDLGDLARQVFEQLCSTDPNRRVALRIPGPIPVSGDPRLLRVLLENLLGNAWKFTAGTPEPAIDLLADASDPEILEVSIRDNGAGFPSSQAGRLFTPFRRLHRSDEFPGTGIGLALAKRVVGRHGGQIRAEGEVGHGATITFTLPRGREKAP